MAKLTFPKDFKWGVAASAYQVEGAWNEDGKGESIWDRFCHTPGKIILGETGDTAIDHYHRYKEDISLMASLGIPAYRFSVAWTRILPEGRGKVNQKGLDFYSALVDELLKKGIEPYACLFHYDLPQALQEKGGWPERSTVEAFADYAAVVTEKLSDRVGTIITHNEPWVTAMAGYFSGDHAPGIKDPVVAMRALHHLLLSHGLAAEAIRAHARKPVKVGIVLNLNPIYPASENKKDRDAAGRMDALMNRAVLDPILKGTTPIQEIAYGKIVAASFIKPGDLEKIRTCDLLGVNYYTRAVVKNDPKFPVVAARLVHPEGNEYSGMWEIYPAGLFETLERVWKDYRPECELMVTENGVPVPDGIDFDGRVRDERRIRYIRKHLAQIHRAINNGIPVSGYFHWSFMDNFEWALGYSQHYGLVYVDTADQKRVIKDSGRWFTGVIRANALEE
jgi:beta-glucosidase